MYEILIVDDEPMVIHGLCKQIDWESYTLAFAGTAETGETALELIKNKTVDILFTDICMPKMDGLQLISAAKKINPALRCVVISSHSEFKYVKKALLLGVENYLLKPIDQDELNQTLEKIIDNLKRDSIIAKKDSPDSSDFRTNVLDRWVHGTIQDYEFYERATLLDINLSAKQYQICLLDLVNVEKDKQRLAHSEMLLKKCINILPSSFEGECFVDSFNRVVLILSGDELNSKEIELNRFLKDISNYSTSNSMKIFAGISPISEGVENIAHNYSDAVLYLNYRFIDSSVNHILCEEIMNDFNRLGCEPVLIQIEKALMEEDLEKSNLIIQKFLDTYSTAPMKIIKNSLIPMILMIIRKMIESGHASEMLTNIDTIGFSTLNSIDSMTDCRKWISKILNQSFEVMNKRKTTLHLLVQRTLDVINKNYHTELSLKTIASDFKLSPAYLGQLFRDETGKHFSSYLTEVRLNASRVLLLETDLKIMEILYRIGISNQSYFNRVFKKAYGISPLDFRYQGSRTREKEP